MKMSELRKIVREEVSRVTRMNEEDVYVSAEFEEIDGAIDKIIENIKIAYTDKAMVRKYVAMLVELQEYNVSIGVRPR
jgi:hypothetical protein